MTIQQLDIALLRWANNFVFQGEYSDTLIVFFVEWLPYWFVVGLAVFAVLALLPRYRRFLRWNWGMVATALAAGLIARYGAVELIRAFYDRSRPLEALADINQLLRHSPGHSFPSGHAAFFFAVAAVIGRSYPKTSIAFYIAAILLTFSRVIVGFHWPSDIFGGAMIGITVGLISQEMIRRFSKRNTE